VPLFIINKWSVLHTLYGHNSKIVVANGQEVKKGQFVAYSGSTGYSTGPHVYYEIRVNGTAVDPARFLN
jgi:murein DD-endopeptidase MepM/ murein hydrolase activator NlpD